MANKYTYEFGEYKLIFYEISSNWNWNDNQLETGIINIYYSAQNGELPLGFLTNYLEVEFLTKEIPLGLFNILMDNSDKYIDNGLTFIKYTTCKLYKNNDLQFVGALVDEGQITEIGLFKDGTFKIKFVDFFKSACESINPANIECNENDIIQYDYNKFGGTEKIALVFNKGTTDHYETWEWLGYNVKYVSYSKLIDAIINNINIVSLFYFGLNEIVTLSGIDFLKYSYYKTLDASESDAQTNVRGTLLDSTELYFIYERGATVDDSGYNVFDYIGSKYKNLYDFLHDLYSGLGLQLIPNYSTETDDKCIFENNDLLLNTVFDFKNPKIEKSPQIKDFYYDTINIIYNVNENNNDVTNIKDGIKKTLSGDEYTALINLAPRMNAFRKLFFQNIQNQFVFTEFNWLGVYYKIQITGDDVLVKANDKVKMYNGTIYEDDFLNNDYRNIIKIPTFNFDDYCLNQGNSDFDGGCIMYQTTQGLANILKLYFFNLFNNAKSLTMDIESYGEEFLQNTMRLKVNMELQPLDAKFQTYFDSNFFFWNEYSYDFVLKKITGKVTGINI